MSAGFGFSRHIRDLLPDVLIAGEEAGRLTESGAGYISDLLPVGIPVAPPEGDGETGMTATNSVSPGTGNVSAGTSIFAMVVLDKPLCGVYPEIDIISTPTGEDVAMVHCNNCTGDMNAWAGILRETAELFGASPDTGELFTRLYKKSLEGKPDCGGITVYNYTAGEGGPYGMALLAAYMAVRGEGETLRHFLAERVFAGAKSSVIAPDDATLCGFDRYVARFAAGLDIEKTAIERI